jgi:hypothetical protein
LTSDYIKKIEKLRVNMTREAMFDPHIVLDMLEEAGKDWRVIWEELPSNQIFDQLYAQSGKYEAFIYQDALFERRAREPDVYFWEPNDGPETIAEWILDNPPFECCVAIADLYRYASGVKAMFSPWLIFLAMAGYSVKQEVTSVNIGGNDATFLGNALAAWGEYADVIFPYINLILHFTDQDIPG